MDTLTHKMGLGCLGKLPRKVIRNKIRDKIRDKR